MAKTYNAQIHTMATVIGLESPRGIIHTVTQGGTSVARVWIEANYGDENETCERLGYRLVGDGVASAFDEDGNCVLSVPVEACEFLSEEDAAQLAAVEAVDERLMRQAIG